MASRTLSIVFNLVMKQNLFIKWNYPESSLKLHNYLLTLYGIPFDPPTQNTISIT